MVVDRAEIAAQLRRDITSGEYKAGDKLPSLRELARRTGAASNTVGEAIRLLASEGLVTLKQNARAEVRTVDDAERTRDDRLESAHGELRELRAELRDVRDRLGSVEERVATVLADLE